MKEVIHVLCPSCWEEVDAAVEVIHEQVDVRGTLIEGDFEYPLCPVCGERIGQAVIMDRNFEKMYRQYRDMLDIPQPEDIVALRKRYGFTQRVLAAILGIGVASLQRYERGCLATDAHAELLRNARDARFLKKRLLADVKGLTDQERRKALESVERGLERFDYAVVRLDVLDSIPRAATEETGLRAFDPDRLRETVVYLAAHVCDLYRTKLNKVLFYLDFAAYRRDGSGFTGLRYAKADFGPVPDQYELVMAALLDGKDLALREKGEGQVIVARRGADLSAFPAMEVTLLDAVCAFANSFESTSALSEFSHKEPGWIETELGGLIPYQYASELQWEGAATA